MQISLVPVFCLFCVFSHFWTRAVAAAAFSRPVPGSSRPPGSNYFDLVDIPGSSLYLRLQVDETITLDLSRIRRTLENVQIFASLQTLQQPLNPQCWIWQAQSDEVNFGVISPAPPGDRPLLWADVRDVARGLTAYQIRNRQAHPFYYAILDTRVQSLIGYGNIVPLIASEHNLANTRNGTSADEKAERCEDIKPLLRVDPSD